MVVTRLGSQRTGEGLLQTPHKLPTKPRPSTSYRPSFPPPDPQYRPHRVNSSLWVPNIDWQVLCEDIQYFNEKSRHLAVHPKIGRYNDREHRKIYEKIDAARLPYSTTIGQVLSTTMRKDIAVRAALFVCETTKRVKGEFKESPLHCWMAVVVKHPNGKKTVLVWDPNSVSQAASVGQRQGEPVGLSRMNTQQVSVVKKLVGQERRAIENVFYGGYGNEYEPKDGGICLAAAQEFMRRLSAEVEQNEFYRVEPHKEQWRKVLMGDWWKD